MYSANHAFNRVYKPLLDALGLTYPQYLTLLALWAEDDQTVGSLGGKLFLESSTLTPLLKRLEAMGHVVRRRDPADASGADRPFSLRFTGPTEPVLTQGMHDLDHPETPFAGLFLTRIMAAGPAPVYEAVFG